MVSFAWPPGSPCAATACKQYDRAAGSGLRQSASNSGSRWRGSAASWGSAATGEQQTLAARARIRSLRPYDDLLSRTATPHRGRCDGLSGHQPTRRSCMRFGLASRWEDVPQPELPPAGPEHMVGVANAPPASADPSRRLLRDERHHDELRPDSAPAAPPTMT